MDKWIALKKQKKMERKWFFENLKYLFILIRITIWFYVTYFLMRRRSGANFE